MESLPINPLLKWPQNALQDIRKIHNLDKPGRIEEAVAILVDWVNKQDHFLKKNFSKEYLERSLIVSKGSVEKTKTQLDNLCTMKTLLPHFFTKYHVKQQMEDIFKIGYVTFSPTLTKDFYRILMVKIHAKNFEEKDYLNYFQYIIVLCEYLKLNEYANGFIIVYDLQEINLSDAVTTLNPILLQQFTTILTEGFGARMKSIHFITPSKAIDILVKIIKQFLNKKIANRVFVHKSLKELYTNIPQHLLPEDYGGNERSIKELAMDCLEEISTEENIGYLKMMSEARTDESLRRSDKFNEEYLGMPGSFRNLKVD